MTFNFFNKPIKLGSVQEVLATPFDFSYLKLGLNGGIIPPIIRILKEWRGSSPLKCAGTVANPFEEVKVYGNSVQSDLPDGYTQLEYIESTDTQYINTGFIPTLNTKARVKFSTKNTNGTGFFGSRFDPYRFSCTTFSSGKTFAFAMTNNTWSSNKTEVELNKKYDCIAYNGKQIINGVEYDENVLTEFETSSRFLLAPVQNNGTPLQGFNARFYLCQLWENDVLMFDGIPAKRNSDNEIGMYDTVSNTFCVNQGTGSFIAGDVVTPTPEAPIEIKSVGDYTGIPSGYTQLEYIESTGTQYINTGIVANSKQIIDIDYTYVSAGFVFGARLSSNNGYSGVTNESTGPYNIRWGNTVLYNNAQPPKGRNKVHIEEFNVTINGEKVSSLGYGTDYVRKNLYLGNMNNNGSTYGFERYGNNKIHSFSIKENNAYSINLIPAKRNSDNAIGMYDTVSKTFFTNAGTGTFIAGDVVGQGNYKVPVEVKSKNLLEVALRDKMLSQVDGVTTLDNNGVAVSNYIDTSENKTFITSNAVGTIKIFKYGVEGAYIDANTTGTIGNAFTVGNEVKFIRIQFNYASIGTDKLQLEEGSSATSYEPYSKTTTNLYLSEPLRKIGTYADTVSVKGTNVTVVRNVEVLDDTGTKTIEESYQGKTVPTTETFTIDNTINALNTTSIVNIETITAPSEIYCSEYIGE